jgi:hypothetical protein
MKTDARVVIVAAIMIAVALAGCDSHKERAAGKRPAVPMRETPVREIRMESPEPVLENGSVASVSRLRKDKRGDTLIRTEHGSRYYLTVGTAPALKIGDRVIVKPVADSDEVSVSVNGAKIYSGRIVK